MALPPVRSRAFYRLILAHPLAALTFAVATGRASIAWPPAAPSRVSADSELLSTLAWFAVCAPLFYTAWRLGRENTAARRREFEVFAGLREVFRRAFGRADAAVPSAEDLARPPRDNPERALAFGTAVAVAVPALFAGVIPPLRSGRGLVWLAGAGVLMGSLTYARYRAAAYLRDEPRYFDPFRYWRLLNTARYDEAGRPFVRWQIVGSLLLALWWLGLGPFLALNP